MLRELLDPKPQRADRVNLWGHICVSNVNEKALGS